MTSKQLPSKESTLFRSIVKYYELKQYKKGLKAADQILKKFPEHGETLAMKGLTLNCMGKKEEAYEFVRLGLRHDLKSHVCWHVFGLLYRSDRNYAEAIKCYRNAIRIDPENLQILRDLYLLQTQMRDLKGNAETRRTMLTLKPNNRNNWIGFAIAHHLLGNYQMAIDIIDKYFSTCEQGRETNYEESEIYMYQNQLIEESGDIEKALEHLETNQKMILDTLFWRQKKAEYLCRLDQFDQALKLYEELLDINPDNYTYHHGLVCVLLEKKELLLENDGIACLRMKMIQDQKKLQTICAYYSKKQKELDQKDPRNKSMSYMRIPLDFLQAEEKQFKEVLDLYMKRQLTKGIPSLGSDLKTLYAKPNKIKIIEELLVSYLKTLKDMKKPLIQNSKESLKDVLVWTQYFAAQHFDRLKNYPKAMESIDFCINSSPKVLDFTQRKARIYKHMGDLQKAADMMVTSRKMDLADRYINNKATEYLLHADRIEEADATIALFTRHEGDPQQNLYDMQCMWYENECGKSRQRLQEHGLALKRFFAVEKHFHDFIEDQFDFHSYCIRKMTLKAYVQVLRFCDTIYGQKAYVEAAHGAIETYLTLIQQQQGLTADGRATNGEALSAAEKKKQKRLQAKARKQEFKKKEEEELKQKLQKEQEEKEKEQEKESKKANKNNSVRQQKEPPKDLDPNGDLLLQKPALEEAWRFVTCLQEYAPKDLRTQFAAFDVAFQKKKVLLCLQALLRAQKIDIDAGTNRTDAKEQIKTRLDKLNELIKTVKNPIVLQVIQESKTPLGQL